MSGSINNNIAINPNSNDYNINDKQTIDAKTTLTKTLESGGITNISYTNQGGKQVASESKENLMAALLTDDPKATGQMATELCSNLPVSALKSTAREALDIISGLTVYAQSNVKATGAQTNAAASSTDVKSLMGNFSNFDIRELMKLLIQAFAQYFTSQRELDLATITQIQTAMEAKISAMEKEKDETYKAAMAQAIGSIVAGSMSVLQGCFSVGAGVCNIIGGVKGANILSSDKTSTNSLGEATEEGLETATNMKSNNLDAMANTKMNQWNGIATTINGIGTGINGLGGIATGVTGIIGAEATKEAKDQQIEQTKQDAVLEILKKMQNDGSEQAKQLMDFIARILSMIQELQQSAAQTEKTIVQA